MDKSYLTFEFNKIGLFSSKKMPHCVISLISAGTTLSQTEIGLKNREKIYADLNLNINNVVSTKQIHSKNVFAVNESARLANGDGVITKNPELIPSVVVADCMPIFLFDPVTRCFGVLHSGWQGTGIVYEAIKLAKKKYDANPQNFLVILGPHIRSCCYTIEKKRASYFVDNFGSNCIHIDKQRMLEGSQWPYRLSLVKANLKILSQIGVPFNNILDTNLCTCCEKYNSEFVFGSHRRETEGLAKHISHKGKFTQMIAFIFQD